MSSCRPAHIPTHVTVLHCRGTREFAPLCAQRFSLRCMLRGSVGTECATSNVSAAALCWTMSRPHACLKSGACLCS